MRKQWWTTAVLVVVVGTWGCGDDEGEADSTERPVEAKQIVSDEILADFQAAGATVYLGMSAPDISGTYYFGDPEVQYTDSEQWPATTNWCHQEVSFEPGENDHQYTRSVTSPNCDSSSEGLSNYISGDDGCFTLYGESFGNFQGCETHTVSILSACLDDNGDMVDPQSTAVSLSVEGDSCDASIAGGNMRDQGEIAIILQADGRAVLQ